MVEGQLQGVQARLHGEESKGQLLREDNAALERKVQQAKVTKVFIAQD